MGQLTYDAGAEALIHLAWLSAQQCDWPTARTRWENVRARFPDRPVGYLAGGVALRELGALDAVEALLDDAVIRFPEHEQVAVDHAAAAAARRDWRAARARWESVRARYPENPAAYLGSAIATRELGALAAADALLEEAAQRFPDHQQIAIVRASLAMARRDWAAARTRWETVRNLSPDNPAGFLNGSVAMREMGALDAASTLLDEAVARFPEHEQIAVVRASVTSARRDWPAAVSRWDECRSRFPGNPSVYIGSINAHRGAGRTDQIEALCVAAEAALLAAQQRGFDATAALKVEFEIARARYDWLRVRQFAKLLVAGRAANAREFVALAQAYWHLGDPDLADDAAASALDIDSTLTDAVAVRGWVATGRGDGDGALACQRRLVELNPGEVRGWLKLVQVFLWLGRREEAASVLEDARRRWPVDPLVRFHLQTYETGWELTLPEMKGPAHLDPGGRDDFRALAVEGLGAGELLRRPIVANPEIDVLVAEARTQKTAVLAFTDFNDGIGMSVAHFDRYLARLDVPAIYLRDFSRLRYLQGVGSLGPYDSTLAALRDMRNQRGVTRLCTLGYCVGGFAAIRYGVELGADRIVAFGAPTFSGEDCDASMEQGNNFQRKRLAVRVSAQMADLRSFLEGHRYSGHIELLYGDEDPRDREHALRLAGIPGVTLHPQPGVNNRRLIQRLTASHDDFCSVLGPLLGLRPRAAGV